MRPGESRGSIGRLSFLMLAVAALGCVCASAVERPRDAAASSQNSTVAPVKGDGGTLRLLINPSGSQSFPGLTIKKYGLDRKYGFDLQMIPAATTQAAVVAMQSGGAEIGAWNWPDVVRMRAAGTKVIGIGPLMKWANTVVVPINSTIGSLADLKGKKFGIIHRTGLDWIVMRALAQKKYGFNIEAELTMQEAGIQLLRGLIEQGKLDATLMYNDYTPGMVASGQYRQLARIKDYVDQLGIPDTPYLIFAARLDYAQGNPGNIRAFLAAYRDAVDLLMSDDAAWIEPARTLSIVDPAVVGKLRDQTRPLLVATFSSSAEAEIRRTFDILVETAGPGPLGMTKLPEQFMTLEYQ
jgi:NitT/TauT family transport system substrate-binding protein